MLRQYPRLLLVLILLSLSAYAQAAAHTIKESGVPTASDGVVNWLDNQRVLFAGQKRNTSSGSPIEYELSVWNTATGSVSPYSGLQGTARICIRGNYISYIRPKPGAEEWLLVYGKIQDDQIVEEQVTALPSQYQVNPFSCRYYASPPPWKVIGRATTPLLEEDGYVDWGTSELKNPEYFKNTPITLYPPGNAKGIPLPVGRRQVQLPSSISYAAFRKAYLLSSDRYRDPTTGVVQEVGGSWPKGKPVSVWWLTPDGTVTEAEFPYHPFMVHGSRGFLAVKDGIFAWSHAIALRGGPGDAGGYLFREGTIRKLITGMLHRPAISQDGCKVAFVHDPEFPTDQAHRSTVKVKVINLCEGGR